MAGDALGLWATAAGADNSFVVILADDDLTPTGGPSPLALDLSEASGYVVLQARVDDIGATYQALRDRNVPPMRIAIVAGSPVTAPGVPGTSVHIIDKANPADARRVARDIRAEALGPLAANATGMVSVRRVGWAAYVVTTERGTSLLVDPYLSGSEGFHTGLPASPIRVDDLTDVDVIAVTHAGYDHRGQSLEIAKAGKALLVSGPALYEAALSDGLPAERLTVMVSGMELHYRDVVIKALPARHASSMTVGGAFQSAEPLSFLVTTAGGCRIFCGGDSSLNEDFRTWREVYAPEIAVLGIGGIWVGPEYAAELPPAEAATAAAWLGVTTVIPVHYAPGDPAATQLRADLAEKEPRIEVVVLEFGNSWTRAATDHPAS